ncbi:COMPASS component SWD3 [Fistulifera solaris]|uniref:COMPASS component SWD3 n=1 Tax=Fistulifera solaris TaxID=1519565 RepID=A0A1Z5JW27_FISSO|nr:COMPASS component SWD3 [Fistulifera solaris]|eukprot:GAX17931.1 COMPASS component SWD3 [Fistulifera solaris]
MTSPANKKRPLGSKDEFYLLPFHGEHKRAVSTLQFAPSNFIKPNNVMCASASADGTAKIWDISLSSSQLKPLGTCTGHARGINQVSWNRAAPFLATASDDRTVRLWDAVTAEALVEFRGHSSFVFCVDQTNNMLVSGSFDETVKLWDVRSGECVCTLPAHSDPVTAVSFGRDGTTVASASHDGLIRIWDVATGECLKTIYAAGNPPVSTLRYAPNGKYLLAGTLDSVLRLWPISRTASNQCVQSYATHQGTTHAGAHVHSRYSTVAAFTSDGKSVVVGSETGKVVVYDLQTAEVQQVLEHENEGVILAVDAHDKLPFLCSGGMTSDRKVSFWAKPGVFEDSAMDTEGEPGSPSHKKARN